MNKKPTKKEKHKPRRARRESFRMYIYKLLKQTHPDMNISVKTMSCLNSFVMDIFERLANESSRLAKMSNRSTLAVADIQTSMQLVVGGELAKHGNMQGYRATSKYMASRK